MPTAKKKKVTELDIKSMARAYTPISIKRLAGYVTPDHGVEPDIQLRAIGMLMDRGWGRPNQDSTHEVKGEIKVILRQMLEDEDE